MSTTPDQKRKWVDLFGRDPSITGAPTVPEFLLWSLGESKPGCWFHPTARLHDCADCRAAATE